MARRGIALWGKVGKGKVGQGERGALAPLPFGRYYLTVQPISVMSPSLTWVSPRHVDLKSNDHGDYYAFIAIDRQFKRYRIFSDARFKPRFVHFLAAIEAGVEAWMPIEPKREPGLWQVALDHVDEEPPSVKVSSTTPMQLSFKHPRRNFASMVNTRKQTFIITDDYSKKADRMAKKLDFSTKSDFLANVVADHLDLCDKMEAIC
jgi:hypothetical protein